MTSEDEEAVIAKLHHAFVHNVKSRPEAARIRNELAVNVNSYIIYDEYDKGFPTHVKPPGKEIAGSRRRYLNALRANVEARELYQQSSVNARESAIFQGQRAVPTENIVLSHIEASRLRRNHQELGIRARYVQSLCQDASASCNLDISESEQPHCMNGDNFQDQHDRTTTSATELKALTSKLEKAILQANYQLERQMTLLAEIRRARTDSALVVSGARARAVAATRDVLVAWLDEKLSESGADRVQSLNETHGEPNAELVHSLPSLAEHYRRYLDARKAVVQAADEALRPFLSPPYANNAENKEGTNGRQSPALEDLPMIHATSQYLAPFLQIQADSSSIRSYLIAQIAKDRHETTNILERLRDESHLLSTYPSGSIYGKDELRCSVLTWKSVASAASGSEMKTIEQNEKMAQQALKDGKDSLAKLMAHNDNHNMTSRKADGIHWKDMHGELRHNDTT